MAAGCLSPDDLPATVKACALFAKHQASRKQGAAAEGVEQGAILRPSFGASGLASQSLLKHGELGAGAVEAAVWGTPT